ncbi:hypothetical protein [Chitinolyticbacter meiyuanensis]|uniref:hypothetical protein n=1 Tax=Chitinolyticbacter meiyuanensis TaxID=682798 RepID=UPI0011E5C974|nr:hypothetical protein [Chitinolyticbacter meiyuanensis]
MHMLAMGPIGIRLYARILTAEASRPDELADHVVDEINCYLPRASSEEQVMLFQLACETHELLGDAFERVDDLAVRRQVIDLLSNVIQPVRALPPAEG